MMKGRFRHHRRRQAHTHKGVSLTIHSIWTSTASLPTFPALSGEETADAAIIGGGLAGILTAHLLRQAGQRVLVLEAGRIGSGQTAGTTAKLTAQHGLRYHRLIETLGQEAAGQYAHANLAAVARLRQLVQACAIDCDLTACTTYLYAVNAAGLLLEEYNACRELGLDVFLTDKTELPFSAAALGLRDQAQFHPLKLLAALANGLPIREHSRVRSVEGGRLVTEQGAVTAEKIIFACHFPFVNLPGYYFARQHQERSYVLGLKGAPAPADPYLSIEPDGLSFRRWGDYLLLGGGGHRTGDHPEGGSYEMLRQAARRYFPDSQEVAAWSAQDCIPMDGVPYIGQFSSSRPDWLVATGFQKWGMSSAMLAAETLSAMALGQPPPADTAVFSPLRFKASASARQLAEDTATAAKALSRRILEPGRIPAEELPVGHGGVVELEGEKLGVYRDGDGTLHAVSLKCPHLGCQLAWNPDEKSWDCPCHGSRFDIHGRLLDGPAQQNLS